MADLVQQNLEDMIPELNAFSSLKIFKSDEIQHIISIRKDFEFQIINNDPLISKNGYKQYIKFEKQLNNIVKTRIKVLRVPRKTDIQNGKKRKKIWRKGRLIGRNLTKTDPAKIVRIAISRRIHFLYKRAIRKFPEDTYFWLQYIIYCITEGSHRQAEDSLWNFLSKKPNNTKFWLYTANLTFKKRGIDAAIRVLTRSLRNITDLKLFQNLFSLQIEAAHKQFLRNIDVKLEIPAWEVIFRHGLKKLSREESAAFFLGITDKLCKALVSGRFRDSLVGLDNFLELVNGELNAIAKDEPLIAAYLWRVEITKLLFSRDSKFEDVFNKIFNECKGNCFKTYLLSAMIFYTFNELDFYTIEDQPVPKRYLLSFESSEMISLFPAQTRPLQYYPELLIIAGLSPFSSEGFKSYIITPNLLAKTKEYIAEHIGLNWNEKIEELIKEDFGNTNLSEQYTAVTALLQVLKACGKQYNHLLEDITDISEGILAIFLLLETTSLDSFKEILKRADFRVKRDVESELLIGKMLQLGNSECIVYELLEKFSDDLLEQSIEHILRYIKIKEMPMNISARLKLRLCEVLIKKLSKEDTDKEFLLQAHSKRLEAMEQLNVDKKTEASAWLEWIEASKELQGVGVYTPGAIYNKAVSRLGANLLHN